MWPEFSARAMLAAEQSHTALIRVEAWSNGQQLSDGVEFSDGEVKDEWTIGTRRSLRLTVPQTSTWLRWLALPNLELRPYRGVRLGHSKTSQEWCPLGRFEVKYRPRALRGGDLSLQANDWWQRVTDQTFEGFRGVGAVGYSISDIIVELIVETGIPRGFDDNTSTSTALAPEYNWEKSRHDAIVDACTSISAEAFVDRLGSLKVQDAQVGTAPVWWLAGGLIDVDVTSDWAYVKNVVIVRSSAQDVDISARVAVSDSNHPAHRNYLGSDVIMVYESQLITTQEQADETANTLLWKHSWPARQMSISMMPNPALDAGDVVYIDWGVGKAEPVQIQTITHPLTLDGICQVTTVGAKDD